jgi:hypothetical protein
MAARATTMAAVRIRLLVDARSLRRKQALGGPLVRGGTDMGFAF